MDQSQYRALAYAIALATGVAAMPHTGYAETAAAAVQEAQAAATETAQADEGKDAPAKDAPASDQTEAKAAPAGVEAARKAEDAPAKTMGTADKKSETQVDPRTANWSKTRPQEDEITANLKQYDGQTVVDVVFDGASDVTLGTAKAAVKMKAGDVYASQMLEKDREAIYDTGYFYDLYPTFETVPEGVVITYHVLENPVLASVRITGNTVEKDETLMPLVTVEVGKILNTRVLHENVQALQEQYRKDGYILAKITDMNIDRDGNLVLKINEGNLEGYTVKGNEKTKKRVILREMRQKPGEPFNSKQARRGMQRVYNLGFFEDVNVKMNPGVAPNAVVMEIDVKEKRTGSFGIGAGYSSADGVIGMLSVGDTNFRGTGDAVSLTYEVSGDDKDAHGYRFAYRHPWLDSKETAISLRVYNRTYEYDDYDSNGDLNESYMRKYAGGEISLSRPVSEYSTNSITIKSRDDKYVRHTGGTDAAKFRSAAWQEANFGKTNSITLLHVTDTRDNVYDPHTGGRVSLMGEFAGFGGDFTFQKFSIEDQRYFPVGHAQVLALRAQYGAAHGDLSYFNQFTVGGQDTLRGYREDQFRGSRMAIGTVEYRFPIVKKVQGAVFTDFGGAWDDGLVPDNLKVSVGVGLALNTPLGPLRLDYGRNKDGGRVHFTVGGTF